jgi:hypothetical protein
MSVISESKLGEKFSPAFQAKLDACTNPEQIKELMHQEELSRGLIKLDWDESFRIPVETPQPTGLARSVTIAGKSFVIEGKTELELEQNQTALYRRVFAEPAAGTEQPRDPASGQFRATADQERAAAASVDAAAKVELDLKFKRGEISAAEYIEQSGAVKDYLAKEGVSIDALKTAVDQTQTASYEQSWAQATEQFLASSDWPGGTENQKRLGETLIAMGATKEPSVKTLRRAYDHLKKNNLLVENAELTREKRLAEAKTPAEIREILDYRGPSGIWGGR